VVISGDCCIGYLVKKQKEIANKEKDVKEKIKAKRDTVYVIVFLNMIIK
jgi:hypothetical protein